MESQEYWFSDTVNYSIIFENMRKFVKAILDWWLIACVAFLLPGVYSNFDAVSKSSGDFWLSDKAFVIQKEPAFITQYKIEHSDIPVEQSAMVVRNLLGDE